MKPVYVVLLMGAAAVAGGLLVRYSDRPVQTAQAHSTPPTVIAPPVPPPPRPIRPAPIQPAAVPSEKPSALSLPVHVGKPEHTQVDPPPVPAPTIVARTRIAPDPPAVTQLERSTIPPPVPAPPSPTPKQPGPNRVTLQPGAIISVRIAESLSTDRTLRGDIFTGTLDRPLIAGGFVVAERGARARGEVVTSSHAGHADGLAELVLQLNEIVTSDGQRVRLVTQPWRKQGVFTGGENEAMVARHPADIKPQTSIPFRLDQPVELTERR